MRIVPGAAVIALVLAAGCANKSTTAQTPGPGTTSAGAQDGARSGGAAPAGTTAQGRSGGAQAAAAVTPQQLDAAMKMIGATNGTLGMKLMAGDLKGAADDAQKMATAFADAERFFAQVKRPDAVMWAQQARMAASETAAAAAAGDVMKAQAARSNMTAQCKQCHATYRDGDAQTGYRIKAGVI